MNDSPTVVPPPAWDDVPAVDERVWGPDLFSWAYAYLINTDAWRGKPSAESHEHDRQVMAWRDAFRDGRGWVPDDLMTEIQESARSSEDPSVALLNVVVALDRAYDGISLIRPFVDDELRPLIDEWDRKGTLEKAAENAVLRKGSYWRLGSSLAHYCQNLAWVSNAHRIEVVSSSGAWWALSDVIRRQRTAGSEVRVTIGFAPMLNEAQDVRFEPLDRDGAKYFRIVLDDERQEQLRMEASALVSRFEQEGVNIAFLPEEAVQEATLNALAAAVVENTQQALDADRLPNLRLLVAGTNMGVGRNEAVVIGADGRTVLAQPKLQPWTLSEVEQQRYGLKDELGDEEERREELNEQGRVWLLDDPDLGRIAFLICEDLDRVDPARGVIVEAAPTLVVSPVMDDSFAKNRWAYKAAEDLSAEPGSLVLVANSFVLAEKKRRAQGKEKARVGIAVICHPDDYGQTTIVRRVPAAATLATRELTWERRW